MAKDEKELVTVRLQSAALDEKSGEIVAHGWLDLPAMQNLRVGDYQREILETPRGGRKSSLLKALEANERLPDVMLGMRGEKYTQRGGSMLLENDVYIIDGLQRVSAIRKYAADNPDEATNMRIGAEVRFNTTRDSEKELFTILNVNRKAMSPAVLLRNERNNSNGIATAYGLSMSDKNFALYGKVCWEQQMHRGELLKALGFCQTCVTLHRYAAPGGRQLTSATVIPGVMDRLAATVGLQNFRQNIFNFFEVVDEVWGLRGIKYKDRATHTRHNFLKEWAGVLSDHEDFWDGNRLVVDTAQKSKMKSFPIDDPTIIRLAGAGTAAGIILRRHIIDHMNKGRQTNRHLTIKRVKEYHVGKRRSNDAA